MKVPLNIATTSSRTWPFDMVDRTRDFNHPMSGGLNGQIAMQKKKRHTLSLGCCFIENKSWPVL